MKKMNLALLAALFAASVPNFAEAAPPPPPPAGIEEKDWTAKEKATVTKVGQTHQTSMAGFFIGQFRDVDASGDGVVTALELKKHLIKGAYATSTEAEVNAKMKQWIGDLDTQNQDAKVSLEEYLLGVLLPKN